MTTEYLRSDNIGPDRFMGPSRYKISYRCEKCGNEWSRTMRTVPKNDPPCPARDCALKAVLADQQRQIANLTRMLETGHAPAHIGANNTVKAVDATADIVMQDYGMTNLQDGVRHGESVAQKLPVVQQTQADNYFGAKNAKAVDFATGQQRTIPKKQMDLIGRRAMAGAYRGMAVGPMSVTPDAQKGQPALMRVGVENLGRKA